MMTAFDSNYRFPYEDMKVYHAVQDAIYSAQILKLSQDDIRYFMKEENVFSACEKLLAGNAMIVTLPWEPLVVYCIHIKGGVTVRLIV